MPINLGGNGAQLIINGPAQWIMDNTFTANTAGVGTATHRRHVADGPGRHAGREWRHHDQRSDHLRRRFDDRRGRPGRLLARRSPARNSAIYDGGLITGAGTFIPTGGLHGPGYQYRAVQLDNQRRHISDSTTVAGRLIPGRRSRSTWIEYDIIDGTFRRIDQRQ